MFCLTQIALKINGLSLPLNDATFKPSQLESNMLRICNNISNIEIEGNLKET